MEVEPVTTARLQLRAYRDGDRDEFVELFSDPIVMAHVGGALGPEEARRMFAAIVAGTHRRALAAWMVEEAAGERQVGHAALLRADGGAVELGFVLRPDSWGRGFATEIARALVAAALARHPGAPVIATVDVDHPASRRVLEKAGMVLAGAGRDDDGPHLRYRLPAAGEAPLALDPLPDARDGLTRLERVILVELARLETERGGASVPTAMLYGRVVERLDVSAGEFQRVLSRLVGR